METMAASFGNKPQAIKNTPPVAMANRLTIFVMPTRPTFWLKEVLGSTPKRAAKEEPRPSHITPPDSSLSVASRPIPPSVIPEMSPTVSTAVTMNMIPIGIMARASNTSFTGSSFGMENQLASATLFQFKTQDFVISAAAPVAGSVKVKVLGRMKPMTAATT